LGENILPAKNALSDEDAWQVEHAFKAKLQILESSVETRDPRPIEQSTDKVPGSATARQPGSQEQPPAQTIDKSGLFTPNRLVSATRPTCGL
jgi:hypothetical protein